MGRALRGGRRLRRRRRLSQRERRQRLAPVSGGAPILRWQRLALIFKWEVIERASHSATAGHQQRELQLCALRLRQDKLACSAPTVEGRPSLRAAP